MCVMSRVNVHVYNMCVATHIMIATAIHIYIYIYICITYTYTMPVQRDVCTDMHVHECDVLRVSV